jgi:hypothetical protein
MASPDPPRIGRIAPRAVFRSTPNMPAEYEQRVIAFFDGALLGDALRSGRLTLRAAEAPRPRFAVTGGHPPPTARPRLPEAGAPTHRNKRRALATT